MIITTTGFFDTGSSAITHILNEFDCISVADDVYEIRLLYDPDGIDDLFFHLVEVPHRQNSSFALKRFSKYIDYNSNRFSNHHYERVCGNNFKKISYDYINSLTSFMYKGNSHIEVYEKGVFFTFVNRIYQKMVRLLRNKLKVKISKDTLISNNTKQYATIMDRELFLNKTKEYIGKLLAYFKTNKSDYTVVDQLLPPSNFHRYVEYLPNEEIAVFVVDRDPRDLYVTCKYFLKTKAIPCKNAEEFCNWFEWTRKQSYHTEDPKFVHRIQFEDLIYNYEESYMKIAKICNLDLNKCNKKSIFKPEKSINNTQVWNRFPQSLDEVKYIKERLSKYCFDFDKYSQKPDFMKNNMFDC